ncbi:hypothetical protein AJ80_09051 [Polytolypa hystricis UAMH7299]|uniref:D-xylose reductase [NAD(P)H] n=1 Tax=Polytolypa hystricis (strain UAMH7299) TaxID=1447883 RepID=A0A2B7WWH9_POLH7|nr:hypothetical protein AJ80_09051 [Polytolypa hystricis UAMH7299]
MPSPALSITDTLPLPNSNVKIPQLGFGVYRSTDGFKACQAALLAGYRHIDTAQFYGNEKEVGDFVRSCADDNNDIVVPRDQLFLTTKIMAPAGSAEATYKKLLESVSKISGSVGGFVDLFLIHSSKSGAAGRKELWLALERLLAEGWTRSIGVSNYGVKHIEEMKEYATVWPPHVNQIELHPWCQQKNIVSYCKSHGIVVEAYAPLVRNYKANEPTLVDIANKYDKTTAQILVRYSLQKGWVPMPKSDDPERIKNNADVYDFEISDEDMAILDALDKGGEGAIVQAVENE